MARQVSAARAKGRFADCLRAAEKGDSIVITRHGRPVAALIPAGELKQLERLRAAGPEKGLAGIAGGWSGSQELVRILSRNRRTGPRSSPRLD